MIFILFAENIVLGVRKMIKLLNTSYLNSNPDKEYDLAVYDPPFDMWKDVTLKVKAKTYLCFTNFQNRHHIQNLFGNPKVEMIWHFKDGRWVSHKMPRLTHEHILIYGVLKNDAYTGEIVQDRTPQKKGKGCICRDKNLGDRVYQPRERKMLNSVIEVPRNVKKELGVWGKPEQLLTPLMEWLTSDGDTVWDGFAGSGTIGVIAKKLHLSYNGFEIDQDTFMKALIRIENV